MAIAAVSAGQIFIVIKCKILARTTDVQTIFKRDSGY